jgi:hypothetical protein
MCLFLTQLICQAIFVNILGIALSLTTVTVPTSLICIVPEDPEVEMDDESHALLTSDFEIGHYIRERIVPRAILYYTGRKDSMGWPYLID